LRLIGRSFLFGLPLCQTTGFVESLLGLIGQYWAASSFSTLRWREKTLLVAIPYWGSSGSLNLLVDSTGIKAVGEAVMCQFARLALDKKLEAP
jgi:hypothetical protein